MLVDTVEVTLRAGKGGDGVVAWRREKYVPKGGPDGGDGGRGGSIILRATNNLDTLASFRYRKVFQAEGGASGGSKRLTGRSGEDLELLVPLGTIITNLQTGQVMADLKDADQLVKIARGGKGGLGNVHFATATHQQPQESTKGAPGEIIQVRLELQLIADVALVGEPNAGKSSLIAALTGVEARIGSYPFSTTETLLGEKRRVDARVTLVDLPGLLAGAHQGKGLGDKFLRHAKRVKALLHVIDAAHPDVKKSESVVADELEAYDQALKKLPRLLVFNKIDLLTKAELDSLEKAWPGAVLVSASQKTNLEELQNKIVELVEA